MIKFTFSILLLLSYSFAVLSQNVSINHAEQVAINAFSERLSSLNNDTKQQYILKDNFSLNYKNKDLIHVFNFYPNGFIIVSGNKSAYPVLGFSFESNFDVYEKHPAIKWLLESYSKQLLFLGSSDKNFSGEYLPEWERLGSKTSDFKQNHNIKTTEPLVKTKWNQGMYYNAYCPPDPQGPAGRTVVGCVAVALGKIMHYFRAPEVGVGEYSYHHEDYGTLSVNFSEQSYDYDQMPVKAENYSDELAKLLFHIGVSVDMDYGPTGSGMYNHKGAYTLYTYFDFNSETQYLFRDSLPEDFDWNGTLVEHIDNKIPLYYAGWSDTVFTMGHAFILDAYSDSTHFHINWGWGGSFDGYFYLEDLTPGNSDFTLLHEVIVNAVPNSEPAFCSGEKSLHAYQGIIDDGSGPINFYQGNSSCKWLIAPADSANGIEFNFLKFEINENDEIIIFDGPDINSDVLQYLTGNDTPQEFESTSDKVLIVFNTEEDSENNGWQLSYSGIKPRYCNTINTLHSPSGTISDGSGSYQYHNNTLCTWNIIPDGTENIKITFLEFDTEEDKDYVEIIDENNSLIVRLSGSELPEPLLVEGSKATIMFRTNESVRGGGFKCFYEINVDNIESLTTQTIGIYPNPANEKLFISDIDVNQISMISIFDILGKSVYSTRNINQITDNGRLKINISDFNNGLYFIKLETGDRLHNTKFIINR